MLLVLALTLLGPHPQEIQTRRAPASAQVRGLGGGATIWPAPARTDDEEKKRPPPPEEERAPDDGGDALEEATELESALPLPIVEKKPEAPVDPCEDPYQTCKETCTIEHATDDTLHVKGTLPIVKCVNRCEKTYRLCHERKKLGFDERSRDDAPPP